ncbi:hypothetical protein QTN25_004241 [Entamoeba marina]
MCVNSKFKETTEKLRYNPISITSLKLFPKIQTQYLYDSDDVRVDGIDKYYILYDIDYSKYIQIQENNLTCKYIKYYSPNFDSCDFSIPTSVNILDSDCFSDRRCGTLYIPNSIFYIKNNCFASYKKLTSIILSTNLITIHDNCFSECQLLQYINLPSSLQLIGNSCFSYCDNIQYITIPNSVTSIGSNCFYNCSSLQSIILPTTLSILENSTFKKCSSLRNTSLPNSIISIGVECFIDCKNLTSILLPTLLQYIGNKCFFNAGINEINIPKNTISIVSYGDAILYKQYNITCTNITLTNSDVTKQINIMNQQNIQEFIIPNCVNEIHSGAFSDQKNIQSIVIPTSITKIVFNQLGKNSFVRCNGLKELLLPVNENKKFLSKVNYSEYLFIKRRNIIYGDKIYFSLADAIRFFLNNFKPQSVTIPTTVKYINKHLIDGCTLLTELNYEGDWNNIVVSYNDHLRFKSIGLIFNTIEYTKEDKYKYGNVIPLIVHSLNRSYYDRSNKMFYIPTSITSLDNHMFEPFNNCIGSKLRNILIPTSITIIPKYCFNKCYLLTSISLPSTLTTIEKKAFKKCISLQLINIPQSVLSINDYAFENCCSLTKITLPTTINLFGNKCFKGCNQLIDDINVPNHCF